jgi:FMN phosphatase YigB (HAD superfamily)
VGDSPHHDIAGALGAGFARAWLVDPFDAHHHEDRVRSVADLPALLGL